MQLGGGDFPQHLAAQDRSYDPKDGLGYPVYDGPGSAQSRDLQAQVLQHAAGFKPDVSFWELASFVEISVMGGLAKFLPVDQMLPLSKYKSAA